MSTEKQFPGSAPYHTVEVPLTPDQYKLLMWLVKANHMTETGLLTVLIQDYGRLWWSILNRRPQWAQAYPDFPHDIDFNEMEEASTFARASVPEVNLHLPRSL